MVKAVIIAERRKPSGKHCLPEWKNNFFGARVNCEPEGLRLGGLYTRGALHLRDVVCRRTARCCHAPLIRMIEVLFDDRMDIRAGEKFVEADLLGIPLRLVVSAKTIAQQGVEFKVRETEETGMVAMDEVIRIVLAVSSERVPVLLG